MSCRASAKINIRFLCVLAVAIAALAGGALVARNLRRQYLAEGDMKAGLTALEKGEWAVACKRLRGYLSRRPDDIEILKKFAHAQLQVEPLNRGNCLGAISAYRRLLNLVPDDAGVYENLARLYQAIGDFSELGYVGRKRLEKAPDDVKAPIWVAKSLLYQRKFDEAGVILRGLESRLSGQEGKVPEYVQACTLLSLIASEKETEEARADARRWADRAVEYDPQSPEAHLFRARYLRKTKATGAAGAALLSSARKDLEQAETLKPEDLSVQLVLAEEWIEHEQLDRAEKVLEGLKAPNRDVIRKYYVDPADFTTTRFLVSARWAAEKQAAEQGVTLADEALAALSGAGHRIGILPTVIRLYLAGGKAPQARKCLDEYVELLKLVPDAQWARQELVMLKAMLSRSEDRPYAVIETLNPIMAADSSNSMLWKLLAEAYSRTDQTRQAIRALLGYLKLKPRDPDMTLQLAREYMKQYDWNRAFEAARLAEPLDPTDIVIKLLRIETSVYVAVERSDERKKAWLAALSEELATLRKEHPERIEIRLLQAYIAFHQGRTEQSVAELETAIKECKDTLRAELQLARVFFRSGRLEKAIETCRTATAKHPDASSAWQSLAELLRINKRNKESVEALVEGLKKVKDRWEVRALKLKLAIFQVLDGDRKQGISILQGLATADAHEVRARELLLGLQEVVRDRPVADGLVADVRKIEGEGGLRWKLYQASINLADSNWRAHQQEIGGLLDRCCEADPGWAEPALMLAGMHERLGNLQKAEAVCRRALSADPSAVEIADRLVTLLERQARYGEAKEVLDRLEASPRILSSRRLRVAIGSGNFAQAIDELKLRVANDEQNQDAGSRILLARLIYWETRDLDEALKYLGQAQAISGESMAVTAVQVEIVRAESLRAEEESQRMKQAGRDQEARKLAQDAQRYRGEALKILDEQVTRNKTFSAFLLRGSYLASVGDMAAAEKDYVHLTTFKDHQGRGHDFLGRFYAETGKMDQAVTALESGRQEFPKDLDLKRRLVKTLLVRGTPDDRRQAGALLDELDRLLPNDPELLWHRASLTMADGTAEGRQKAHPMLEKVVELEPAAVNAHLALIAFAIQKGEYAKAREMAIRAQGPNPASIPLLIARATCEQMLGNLPMAVNLARMVLREVPENPDARDVLVYAAETTREPAAIREADELVRKLRDKKPDDPVLLAKAATICRIKGELAQARTLMEQAAKASAENPSVLKEQILLLGREEKWDQLLAIVNTHLAAKRHDRGVLESAANLLAGTKSDQNHAKAMVLYEKVAEMSPSDIRPKLNLALLRYGAKQIDQAEALYREVLRQDPENVWALNDLAWILQEARKDYKAALELADKAARLSPDNRSVLDTRGVILEKMPDGLTRARADFERCIHLASEDKSALATAHLQAGRVCVRLKDLAAARRHLLQAQKLDQAHDVLGTVRRGELENLLKDIPVAGAGEAGKGASAAAAAAAAAR